MRSDPSSRARRLAAVAVVASVGAATAAAAAVTAHRERSDAADETRVLDVVRRTVPAALALDRVWFAEAIGRPDVLAADEARADAAGAAAAAADVLAGAGDLDEGGAARLALARPEPSIDEVAPALLDLVARVDVRAPGPVRFEPAISTALSLTGAVPRLLAGQRPPPGAPAVADLLGGGSDPAFTADVEAIAAGEPGRAFGALLDGSVPGDAGELDVAAAVAATTAVTDAYAAAIDAALARRLDVATAAADRAGTQRALGALVAVALAGLAAAPLVRLRRLRRERWRSLGDAAHADALTGLLNRRGLEASSGRALTGGHGPVALLLLDVDHFKAVNDTFGHQAGDAVLTVVAERLRASVDAPGSLVCRWAGDEFVALVAPAPEAELAANRIGTRLRSLMGEPVAVGEHRVPVAASVGGVSCLCGACTLDELLVRADEALYDVKRSGRGDLAVVGCRRASDA